MFFFRDWFFINISIIYIKYVFLFVVEVTFFYFFGVEINLFPPILILCEEKKSIFFDNNLIIRALIIYFCFMLIDLINEYKKMFTLVTIIFVWGFVRWFFIRIVTFKRLFSILRSVIRVFSCLWVCFFKMIINQKVASKKNFFFLNVVFMKIDTFKNYFLVWKGVKGMFRGWVKIFVVAKYAF